MKTSKNKKYGKTEEETGPGTYYAQFEGKGKGRRQVFLTHAEELAAARARQYTCYDPNFATPFQIPTNRQPAVFSHALPRYFREELNLVIFGMAPHWGDQLEAFGALFEKSSELRVWLDSRCDEVYASNNRYDHTIGMASRRGDLRRTKALKISKVKARGAIVVSALRQVLSDVSVVIGADGIPLVLTPDKVARRTVRLDIVRGFSAQARKLNWEIQKANLQPDQATEKKGKSKRQKNYKRDGARGNRASLAAAAKAMAETPAATD